jgi:hypothetical protein
VVGPIRHAVPRPLQRVRLIGMDLGIDDRHRGSSSVLGEFGWHSRLVSRGQFREPKEAPDWAHVERACWFGYSRTARRYSERV